jgi:hypothetical protein
LCDSNSLTGVPGENPCPVASHWQILSHNVVSSTPNLRGIQNRRNSKNKSWPFNLNPCGGLCDSNSFGRCGRFIWDQDSRTCMLHSSTIFPGTSPYTVTTGSGWSTYRYPCQKNVSALCCAHCTNIFTK